MKNELVVGLVFGSLTTAVFADGTKNIRTYDVDPIHESWKPQRQISRFSENDTTFASYDQIDVLKYDLELTFDPILGTIQGSNKVSFRVVGQYLDELVLDAVNMEIADVKWTDGSSLLFRNDYKQLKVSLPLSLPQYTEAEITVVYKANRPDALSVAGPDASRMDRLYSAYTYTQPDGTRRWFPSRDVPSDKTLTRLKMTVPKGFNISSNGREFGPVQTGTQQVTYTFDSIAPISTYLTSVVIGQQQNESIGQLRNVPLTISGPSYMMSALRKETSRTAQMMDVFERFTRTPYGFNKYHQSVAEGFSASMEHQSSTTMGGRRIVGDMSGEGVVAHELAHQWFGDLVTCGLWGDMWLNEGFASYLPIVFFDAVGDRHAALASFLSNRDWYLGATTKENARPLSTNEMWPSYDIFDQHSYAKGAMVIHMLRNIANMNTPSPDGVEPFSKALSEYFRSHSYSNVRFSDLKGALAKTTNANWNEIFDQWVLKAGHPIVKGQWSWIDGLLNINLTQNQALETEKPWGTFTFPLSILVIHEDGTSKIHSGWVKNQKESLRLPVRKKVKAIVLDPQLVVPGLLEVDQSVEAWSFAYGQTSQLFTQANIVDTAMSVLPVEQQVMFAEKVLSGRPSAATLALLARKIKSKDDARFLLVAKRILNSSYRSRIDKVFLGDVAALELLVYKFSNASDRLSFANAKSVWQKTRRVEEREQYIQLMFTIDPIGTQSFAIEKLSESKWTDRDRISLTQIIAKQTSDVSRPFIVDMLKTVNTSNIGRAFVDSVLKLQFADPEILPTLKSQAISNRSSSMKTKFVQLIGMQVDQRQGACEALSDVKVSIAQNGSPEDKLNVVRAIEESAKKLTCSF
ncbi:MAG: M1 family metallopeptidase, partial [Proteobacteria bacterium]|nr:M1 family metallopeptidase [Pseudomonadota bacterium]